MVLDMEDVAREIYRTYAGLVCSQKNVKKCADRSHDLALFHCFESLGDRVANFDACVLEVFGGGSQTRVLFDA